MAISQDSGPNYEVEIDADELLEDIAVLANHYGKEFEKNRRRWYDSLDTMDEWHDARRWMLEAVGGRRACSEVLAGLQPGDSWRMGRFRNDDGTVAVRELLRWLSDQSTETNKHRGGGNPQASEEHTAYASVIHTVREDYGVGWPRFDDLGGELECDQP